MSLSLSSDTSRSIASQSGSTMNLTSPSNLSMHLCNLVLFSSSKSSWNEKRQSSLRSALPVCPLLPWTHRVGNNLRLDPFPGRRRILDLPMHLAHPENARIPKPSQRQLEIVEVASVLLFHCGHSTIFLNALPSLRPNIILYCLHCVIAYQYEKWYLWISYIRRVIIATCRVFTI